MAMVGKQKRDNHVQQILQISIVVIFTKIKSQSNKWSGCSSLGKVSEKNRKKSVCDVIVVGLQNSSGAKYSMWRKNHCHLKNGVIYVKYDISWSGMALMT